MKKAYRESLVASLSTEERKNFTDLLEQEFGGKRVVDYDGSLGVMYDLLKNPPTEKDVTQALVARPDYFTIIPDHVSQALDAIVELFPKLDNDQYRHDNYNTHPAEKKYSTGFFNKSRIVLSNTPYRKLPKALESGMKEEIKKTCGVYNVDPTDCSNEAWIQNIIRGKILEPLEDFIQKAVEACIDNEGSKPGLTAERYQQDLLGFLDYPYWDFETAALTVPLALTHYQKISEAFGLPWDEDEQRAAVKKSKDGLTKDISGALDQIKDHEFETFYHRIDVTGAFLIHSVESFKKLAADFQIDWDEARESNVIEAVHREKKRRKIKDKARTRM
jgi:hypothetical protein